MNGTEAVPSGYGLYLLQTLLALGAVCLLAFVVLRLLSGRLHGVGRKGTHLRVIERMALDQRRALYLVEVSGRRLLLGASDSGLRLLAELELDEPVVGQPAAPAATTTRAGRSSGPG